MRDGEEDKVFITFPETECGSDGDEEREESEIESREEGRRRLEGGGEVVEERKEGVREVSFEATTEME